MPRRSIVIVGGGISGLAAAWELTHVESALPPNTRVEVFEASARLGGSLSVANFAGRIVDRGPDGFLARRPEALELIKEMGLGDELEPVAASGASIYLDGRLQVLPTGLLLGVPTSSKSLRSLTGISRRARFGAWRDEHFPRSFDAPEDVAIGAIVRAKLGDEIAEQIVEPMIGGIQAGRIDELSSAAVFPSLLEAARKGGSLMRAMAPAPPPADAVPSPAFCSLKGGMGSLPVELERQLRERGVIISTSSEVTALKRSSTGFYAWEVDTATTTTPANAVIVATPPRAAGRLLGAFDDAFVTVGEMTSASSVMVTFAVAADEVTLPETGTGVLVPLNTPWREDSFMVTALTFLDRKWPHLSDGSHALIRAHVGRIDDTRSATMSDEELVARVSEELDHILGGWPSECDVMVVRHVDGLPQYLVGHLDRVSAAKSAAQPLSIALAGNAYDGVGIPASISSGRRAAREAREFLS